MTRLKTEWIDHMPTGMGEYNKKLLEKAGVDLAGLVMHIYGISEEELDHLRKVTKVAAVPVTQGQGIIGSFAESVAAITASMGFQSFVSPAADVEGVYQALGMGADVLFMADDDRYIALNVKTGAVGENDYATARGFVELADIMAGRPDARTAAGQSGSREAAGDLAEDFGRLGLSGRRVLLCGFGRVGREASRILIGRGVSFDLLEEDPEALRSFRDFVSDKEVLKSFGKFASDPEVLKCSGDSAPDRPAKYSHKSFSSKESFSDYDVVLDFTNKGEWITPEMVRADMIYLSPGVPLSLTEEAEALLKNNCIYDNLEVGTAVMLGEALPAVGGK